MEKKIIRAMFTGDSIGDCGRARPIGDGCGALGDSYIANLFTMTWARYPQCGIRYLNSAVSGNTSRQLLERFDTEVLAYNPDYLFIMIGVNDCWRFYDNPLMTERQISPEETASNVEEMIKRTLARGAKPVILSPFFMDLNREENMRRLCDALNVAFRALTEKYGIKYVDIQSVIDGYIAKSSSYQLSGDRVHPNAIGRALIAKTIYESPVFAEMLAEQN